jgi:hypothetical protein
LGDGDKHPEPAKRADGPSPKAEAVPKKNAPNAYKAARAARGDQKPSDPVFDRAMLRWTKVVAIFTAVLAIVGALQFWSFVQSERASLSVVGIAFMGGLPQAGTKSIHLVVNIRNSGRSTALVPEAAFNLRFGSLSDRPDYLPGIKIAIAPIPADGITNTHAEFVLPNPIAKTDADNISSGALQISFYGYIKYSDEFGLFGHKTLGYCSYYVAVPTLPTPSGSEQFDTCTEPNYTYSR